MAQTVNILLNAADRARLEQIVDDRNRPLKHVLRAKIVLLSGDHLPVLEVARRRQRQPPCGLAMATALR